PRDARCQDRTLQRDFFGAVRAHAPSQFELLVAPWAEFTELGFAVRTQDVLRVDRFAAAGAGPQFARRSTRLRQSLRLEFQGAALGHRERRPDDHVDEETENWQHQGEPGGKDMEQHTVRALAGIAEGPVRQTEPEGQQIENYDSEQRLQRR